MASARTLRARPVLLLAVGLALAAGSTVARPGASAEADVSARSVSPGNGSWSALGAGFDQTAWSLALSPAGDLYAGGNFRASGSTPTIGVARWTGTSWQQVGDGLDDSVGAQSRLVSSLAFGGSQLYAVGTFSRSGAGIADDTGIAVFDGTSWTAVGGGIPLIGSQDVADVVVDGTRVYAGGTFTQAGTGPTSVANIAMWDGTAWSDVGGGFPGSGALVQALARTASDRIVAGGKFLQAGSSPPADDTNIAVWDGTSWSPLAGGLGVAASRVYSVSVGPDDSIYAGGNFAAADGGNVLGSRLALWNGTAWRPVGIGPGAGESSVRDFAFDNTRGLTYVIGNFTTLNGMTMNRVAVWDAGINSWIPLDDGSTVGLTGTVAVGTPSVESLVVSGSHVYMGGSFVNANGIPEADNVARWTWGAPSGTNALSGVPGDTVSLAGDDFIGVPATTGVYFGGVPSPSYQRDDSTSFSAVVVPSGIYGAVPIEVDAVGGRATVGTFTAPAAPAPPTPASAPVDVAAVAGDGSASVSWSAPASPGTFPVSHYSAISTPGAHTCLVAAPALTCDVRGLTNGTAYTFTVKALNGAGWSAASAPSLAVTPVAPLSPTITITGSREGSRIVVTGVTTGFGIEAILNPWLRLAGQSAYSPGSAQVLVSMDATFAWGRKTGKKVSVYMQTPDASVRSNAVTIRAR